MKNPIIYIIDDEPLIAQSIGDILDEEGFEVLTFHSCANLFTKLETSPPPTCFIVDFVMPEMDGLTLIKKLRQHNYWQPFLVVSGCGTIPDVVNFMQQGAITFIEKPFHPGDILSAVRTAVQKHELLAESRSVMTNIKSLSKRESDVLREMNAGKDSESIGSSLGISQKTVEVHKTRIFKKLGYNSTTQVVAKTNFLFQESPE